MSNLEYYEDPDYQNFLISSARLELTPPEAFFRHFSVKNSMNLVDFGMGLGFWTTILQSQMPNGSWIWGVECQQDLIDLVLHTKDKEGIQNFTPFYMDRTDHPLLPEWIPEPDTILASLVLSTFASPGMAMDGLIRSLQRGGKLIVLDWVKLDYPDGPRINEKVSLDRMKFEAEDFKLEITKSVRLSEHIYGLEIQAGSDFEYGYYDLKEEEDITEDSAKS